MKMIISTRPGILRPEFSVRKVSQVFELIRELERNVNSFHIISLSCYVALLNQGCAWRPNVRRRSERSKVLAVKTVMTILRTKSQTKGGQFLFPLYIFTKILFYKSTTING